MMVSSSKSMHVSFNLLCFLPLLLLLITSNHCAAAGRPEKAGTPAQEGGSANPAAVHLKLYQHRKLGMASPYRGTVFNFFPKGSPIPPSGPSKRHNSEEDSAPEN
ncbi:protein IDA [Malania oleifera]|uniref:protein IDA n=1 Tax=Malania oleifera TaxID=397392 RepID=UPI0025AEB99F|nr:protein IDA [Malania oleifera]